MADDTICLSFACLQRLLIRKRSNPDDSNILTLGYREASPGPSGHRVASSNDIMCYYPNTLVALLKKSPSWQMLHAVIGDDLMIYLLMNYVVVVELQESKSFIQVRLALSLMKASLEHTKT